jgi:ADP-ribosylglycohydrolase
MVIPTVLWSLYALFRARPEALYRDAVRIAIAAGGDTDTTAALAGAFAGAVVGRSGLPALAAAVQDRGQWGADELEALAHRAWRLASGMTAS